MNEQERHDMNKVLMDETYGSDLPQRLELACAEYQLAYERISARLDNGELTFEEFADACGSEAEDIREKWNLPEDTGFLEDK